MKTKRENEIGTMLLQAGKMIHKPGLNVMPEGLYGTDGRRCDAKFESPNGILFLEIFGGKDLSYMRDRLLMRDSRIFNRRLGKKGVHIMHLIVNDRAFNAQTNGPTCDVESRLVAVSEELDHYVNHSVRTLPTNPTKKQYREVAMEIQETLEF